ncbi:MAG: NUDIX domain-containing protein [bacterium]
MHVFVFNTEKQILLQQRSLQVDYYPGYFDASVGAQVQSGESYKVAALRETQEELGFTPKILKFITNYNSYSERQKEKRSLYICSFNGKINFDNQAISTIKWFSNSEINQAIQNKSLKLTGGFLLSWLEYQKIELNNY